MSEGIILFGDSVFFGSGASLRNKGCGRLLRGLIKMPVLIKSRNRDTTEDALLRLDNDVLKEGSYSTVVILFGNNDCRLKAANNPLVPLKRYKENLGNIVRRIRAMGKTPLICNLQPLSSEIIFKLSPETKEYSLIMESSPYLWQKIYSDACADVAKNEGISLVNIREPLEREGETNIAADGQHPNDNGHKIIAQQLAAALNGNLKNGS